MNSSLLCSPTSNPPVPIESWSSSRTFLLAIVVSVVVSFTGIFDHSLWTPDEPRDAAIGREMLLSGNLVVPTLAGKPFLEKPPLYWWVMAGLYRLFGVSDGVARTTSSLAGILVLLLVFDVTRRIANPFAGLMATIVTGTMSGFYIHFHRVVVDPWLALFVMLGYWSFVLTAFPVSDSGGKRPEKPSPLGILVVYLAGGLAFLSKGPVGPGLLAVPIAVALLAGRRWDFFRSWAHVPGVLLFLALCLSWPLALYLRGGKDLFMGGFVIRNILFRVMPPEIEGVYVGGHVNPFWYYVGFPSEVMPWLVAFPATGHWLWKKRWPREWNGRALFFLGSVFPVGLLLLSIPGTKRMLYLLPLIAPLGATVGAWLAATVKDHSPHKVDYYTCFVLFLLTALCLFGVSGTSVWAYLNGADFFAQFHAVLRSKPSAPIFFTLAGVLLIVGIVLTTHGVRLWKKRSARLGLVAAWMILALFVLGGSLYYRMGDGFKNLHFLTRDLMTMGVCTPELVGYRLDETTEGFIPYDTGVVLRNIIDPEELNRCILETPRGKLLMFEKLFSRLPEEVSARLQPIRCWRFGDHRAYCLYEFRPAATNDGTVSEKRP
jgi:4-amino-4-deoxy-L-arabinose transferase-like glycosyltransferase